MTETPPKDRHLLWFFSTGIVLGFVILLVIFYTAGYRPGPSFTIVKSGTVVLRNIPAGTTIYADQRLQGATHGGDTRLKLVPGTHALIVEAFDAHPWNGTVDVLSGQSVTVTPILVPNTLAKTALTGEAAARAHAVLAAYTLPTADMPLTLHGGCVHAYVAYGRVLAVGTTTDGCTPPPYLCPGGSCDTDVIFAPGVAIRAVMPYPGHEDALIVSYDDTAAVVGLDPRAQLFTPIMQADPATLLPWTGHSAVLLDTTGAYEVPFP